MATKGAGEVGRTKEYIPNARLARLLIRQPLLISFETREPSGHFRNDAGEDGAETFVESEGRFAFDDHGTCGEETARFCLELESCASVSSADTCDGVYGGT